MVPLTPRESAYPDNPVLVRIHRGSDVESQHRGAWVVTDADGGIVDGAGEFSRPVFVRSTVKSLQALPLLESGAAERFGFGDKELAVVLASHDAEERHLEVVAGLLARLGLAVDDLQCGPEPPRDAATRARLREERSEATALHNNCSGKHAGFLALALHLGVAKERYLDPASPVQELVRSAVLAMSGVEPTRLTTAVDGCSAPTFRMPLSGLATAFARMANPAKLEPARREACERLCAAVADHPEMIAGTHRRICTDIARVTRGRLFPKVGGDAVYGIGVRGSGRGLAIKIDDGSSRGLHPLLVALLAKLGFLSGAEAEALGSWRQERTRNWAGREVGRTEVLA